MNVVGRLIWMGWLIWTGWLIRQDSFICVMGYMTWLIHMCEVAFIWDDPPHSYVWQAIWHDSFICVMWHIHVHRSVFVCTLVTFHVWGGIHVRQPTTFRVCHVAYGVATISRLLKIIGLFCKRALQKRRYSAKETYNFKEPATRGHPIWISHVSQRLQAAPVFLSFFLGFLIDWFWKSGGLLYEWALCTRIAHLPQWGPKMIYRSHKSLSTSRASQLVRKIRSQNQSIPNSYDESHHTCEKVIWRGTAHMAHSYVWQTDSCVWHDSFYVCHDLFIFVTWLVL